MAIILDCPQCGTSTPHSNGRCIQCKVEETKVSKENFLQSRSGLSTEERLTLLESDYFDHQQNHPTIPMRFA